MSTHKSRSRALQSCARRKDKRKQRLYKSSSQNATRVVSHITPDTEADTSRPDSLQATALADAIVDEVEPRFAAFRHRNFRLFWTGNLISLIGTMAQGTAQGWLMRQLTHDPFLITLVAACATAPMLLFTLPAGVLADRVDKRRALIITNATSAMLALALAILVFLNVHQIWHVALVTLAVGTVNAFDIPVRQSFNIEMVGRDDLPNAIAFNSSAFNAARVAGPMVGGFLLGSVGMAGCFLINAFSFVALITGLLLMRAVSTKAASHPMRLSDLLDGFHFVRQHETLRVVIVLIACVSVFAMSFAALLPVFAKDIFASDEKGFSLLLASNGFGALGASVSLAVAGKMYHRGKRLLLGTTLFALCVIGFASSPALWVACLWLVGAGWCMLTFLMTANTMVQTLAPDHLRGRVFSLYSLALIGTSPLGVLLIGKLAQVWNPRAAVQAGASISVWFSLFVIVRFRALWKEK